MFGFGKVGKKGLYALHIDDDSAMRALLAELFQTLGYEYVGAETVMDGLKLAKGRAPAVILMDTMMPEIDGYAACRLVRGEPSLKHVPIVMLTALQRMADVERAFSAGATDYLVKPVRIDRLKQKIGKFLDTSGA